MQAKMKIHNRLEAITRKWWFTLLIIILMCMPSYSTKAIPPEERANIVLTVFAEALVYRIPKLFPIFKLIPLLLLLLLVLYRNKVRKVFSAYVSLNLFLVAIFQNMAYTREYGFTVLTGNILISLMVALAWFWETIAVRNDFSVYRLGAGQIFMMFLAFFAFWYPIDLQTLTPDFKLHHLFTSEAGLTFCMLVPFYLAVLFVIYPRVNPVTLKVTALAGFITGILTVIQFFILNPAYWWMGILHLPLFLNSLYGLVLAKRILSAGG